MVKIPTKEYVELLLVVARFGYLLIVVGFVMRAWIFKGNDTLSLWVMFFGAIGYFPFFYLLDKFVWRMHSDILLFDALGRYDK